MKELTTNQINQLLEGLDYCKCGADNWIGTIYDYDPEDDSDKAQQFIDIQTLKDIVASWLEPNVAKCSRELVYLHDLIEQEVFDMLDDVPHTEQPALQVTVGKRTYGIPYNADVHESLLETLRVEIRYLRRKMLLDDAAKADIHKGAINGLTLVAVDEYFAIFNTIGAYCTLHVSANDILLVDNTEQPEEGVCACEYNDDDALQFLNEHDKLAVVDLQRLLKGVPETTVVDDGFTTLLQLARAAHRGEGYISHSNVIKFFHSIVTGVDTDTHELLADMEEFYSGRYRSETITCLINFIEDDSFFNMQYDEQVDFLAKLIIEHLEAQNW